MDLANPETTRPLALGAHHGVSAGHPLAALAAMQILEAGGNAVDAGVAAGFALNVVQPDMASLGGVAPIMVRMAATGEVGTIAGVGRWPQLATREAVAAKGGGRIPASPARWVTPAAVDAWLTALARYGTLSVADVLAPAIALASEGFPVNYFLHNNLAGSQGKIAGFASTRAIFYPRGEPLSVGALLVQKDLADTLRRLVDGERRTGGTRAAGIEGARDAFYRGEPAALIDAFSREIDAFIRAEDLHAFAVKEEPPLHVAFRGRTVYGCGPWSQGPALLQMLAVAERLDLPLADEATTQHILIEVAKSALADRNRHYGDPDFVDVPIAELLGEAHAEAMARAVDPAGAATRPPEPAFAGMPGPDTTYVAVVDSEGNAFSGTPSDSSMLLTPIVPGLGFAISDRGLQASLDPADPNAIVPGKRPRLTPNPGLVVGSDTVMAYGTPGGEVQTQAMLQFLVNHLDRGLDLQRAIERPRWASYGVPATEDPHPFTPGLVKVEEPLAAEIGTELEARGHAVETWPRFAALAGGLCAVSRDYGTGVVAAGADPRRLSYALAR